MRIRVQQNRAPLPRLDDLRSGRTCDALGPMPGALQSGEREPRLYVDAAIEEFRVHEFAPVSTNTGLLPELS